MTKRENNLKKAIFTALLFCTCCFFSFQLISKTQSVFAEEVHNHCYCSSSACNYQNLHDENISWTAYNKSNRLPNKSGNYYLTTNVTVSEWVVDSNVNLCLNGFSITITETEIEVKENATLTITDCKNAGSLNGNNTGLIVYGTFNLYGGIVNRPNAQNHTIINSGIVNIYDGTILSREDTKSSIATARIGQTSVYGGKIDSVYSLENDSENIVISGGYFKAKPSRLTLLTNRYFVQNTDSQTKDEYPFVVTYHEHEYSNYISDETYHYLKCVNEDCPDKEASIKAVEEHNFTLKSNKEEHWQECLTCGKRKQKENHYGGDSTCEQLASCELCGENYGELKEHVPNKDDGDCTTSIACKICGIETTPAKANHVGGKANCIKKAVCENCGKEYGNLSLEHVPNEDDGSCLTPVNCSLCDAVVIEGKTEHSFSDNLDVHCNNANCNFTRSVVVVKIPTCEKEVYDYTGNQITFLLEPSQNYTISNNVQSEVGVYQLVVSLVKGKNLVWEDGTTHDLLFRFEIKETKTSLINKNDEENYTWLWITVPTVLTIGVSGVVIKNNLRKRIKQKRRKND